MYRKSSLTIVLAISSRKTVVSVPYLYLWLFLVITWALTHGLISFCLPNNMLTVHNQCLVWCILLPCTSLYTHNNPLIMLIHIHFLLKQRTDCDCRRKLPFLGFVVLTQNICSWNMCACDLCLTGYLKNYVLVTKWEKLIYTICK